LKEAGRFRPEQRFLVSIPSPFNVIDRMLSSASKLAVEPAYEAQILAEIVQMAEHIPHADLAIQWDCARDMMAYQGAIPAYFPDHEAGVAARLARLGEAVPEDVELGYHFCYGSFGG